MDEEAQPLLTAFKSPQTMDIKNLDPELQELIMPIVPAEDVKKPRGLWCASCSHITSCFITYIFFGPIFLLIALVYGLLICIIALFRNLCCFCCNPQRKSFLAYGKIEDNTKFKNWQGNVHFPDRVYYPIQEEEISDLIKKHSKIRVVGAGHSISDYFNLPVGEDEKNNKGILISLEKYNKLLNVNKKDCYVTFQTGLHLWQLNDLLRAKELAIPYLGTIPYQTFIGAASTGTHPGSLRFPLFAHLIHSFRLIKANGEVEIVNRDSRLYPALGVSLGLLGIISEVTIRVVPLFALSRHTFMTSTDEFIENWNKYQTKDTLHRHLWYPSIDRIQFVIWHRVPTPQPLDTNFHYADTGLTLVFAQFFSYILSFFECTFIHRCFASSIVTLKLTDRQVTAVSDRTITTEANHHQSNLRALTMELAIPFRYSVDALRTLQTYFLKPHVPSHPEFPIGIRTAKSDSFWLSPGHSFIPTTVQEDGKEEKDLKYEEEEGYIWLDLYWPVYCKDTSTSTSPAKFFDEMLRILKPYQPRAHWGKTVCKSYTRENLAHLYPKYHDFEKLRSELDSEGKFLNSFTSRYFGPKLTEEELQKISLPEYPALGLSPLSSAICSGCLYTSPCTQCCFRNPFILNSDEIRELSSSSDQMV